MGNFSGDPLIAAMMRASRPGSDAPASPAAPSPVGGGGGGACGGGGAASGAHQEKRKEKSPEPRTRRRSTTPIARRRSTSPSGGSDEDWPTRVDVTQKLSRRDIAKLPEDKKEELRQVEREEDVQEKFKDFRWDTAGQNPASGGGAAALPAQWEKQKGKKPEGILGIPREFKESHRNIY